MPTVTQKRVGVIAAAWYAYYHRGGIGYASPGTSESYQRSRDFGPPPNIPFNTDCSAFVIWCYKSAGCKDPAGFDYRQIGSTYTLTPRGRRISSVKQLQYGDLVFYSNPDHVGVYVGQGRVIQHGSEPGPMLSKANYRPITNMRSYIQ